MGVWLINNERKARAKPRSWRRLWTLWKAGAQGGVFLRQARRAT